MTLRTAFVAIVVIALASAVTAWSAWYGVHRVTHAPGRGETLVDEVLQERDSDLGSGGPSSDGESDSPQASETRGSATPSEGPDPSGLSPFPRLEAHGRVVRGERLEPIAGMRVRLLAQTYPTTTREVASTVTDARGDFTLLAPGGPYDHGLCVDYDQGVSSGECCEDLRPGMELGADAGSVFVTSGYLTDPPGAFRYRVQTHGGWGEDEEDEEDEEEGDEGEDAPEETREGSAWVALDGVLVTRVSDAEGRPIPGARVFVGLPDDGEEARADARARAESGRGLELLNLPPRAFRTGTTGTDGLARLDRLGPPPWHVQVYHPEYIWFGAEELEPADAENLVLSRARWLTAQVQWEDGAPVNLAQLSLSLEGKPEPRSESPFFRPPRQVLLLRDGLGFRSTPLSPNTNRATLWAAGAKPCPIEWAPGTGGYDLGVVTLSRGAGFEVTVVDEDGAPVEFACVTTWRNEHWQSVAATDRDGHATVSGFSIDAESDIGLSVTKCGHEDWSDRVFVWRSLTTLRVVLPRFGDLRVRVTDPKGQPIPHARLSDLCEYETCTPHLMLRGIADPRGVIALGLVPQADARLLLISADGFRPEPISLTGERARAIGDLGTVVLKPEASIEGVVRGANGVPRASVRVRAWSLADGTPYPLHLDRRSEDGDEVRTDPSGCFRLSGLLAGAYGVFADGGEMQFVTVDEGECGSVEFVLRDPATREPPRGPAGDGPNQGDLLDRDSMVESVPALRVRVMDRDGAPVSQASVSILSSWSAENDWWRDDQRRTNDSGTCVINRLDGGVRIVEVSHPDYAACEPQTCGADGSGQGTRDLVFRLIRRGEAGDRTVRAKFRATGALGRPVDPVRLEVFGSQECKGTGLTDERGYTQIDLPRPGTYLVRALRSDEDHPVNCGLVMVEPNPATAYDIRVPGAVEVEFRLECPDRDPLRWPSRVEVAVFSRASRAPSSRAIGDELTLLLSPGEDPVERTRLDPGEYQVEVVTSDGRRSLRALTVRPDGESQVMIIALEAVTHWVIHGTARTTHDVLPGMSFTARTPTGGEISFETDAVGQFLLTVPGPGRYRVEPDAAHGVNVAATLLDIMDPGEQALLFDSFRATLRFVDEAGSPVANARGQWQRQWDRSHSFTTDRSGVASISCETTGPHEYTIQGDDGTIRTGIAHVQGPGECQILVSKSRSITLRPEPRPPGMLTATAWTRDGRSSVLGSSTGETLTISPGATVATVRVEVRSGWFDVLVGEVPTSALPGGGDTTVDVSLREGAVVAFFASPEVTPRLADDRVWVRRSQGADAPWMAVPLGSDLPLQRDVRYTAQLRLDNGETYEREFFAAPDTGRITLPWQ
ncbi:MAG: carboxypeptidase-like regulatory domain-containing protein [Planctomycetota bacterium]